MTDAGFAYLAHFYVFLLFSFSICLLLIAGKLNRTPTIIWVCSNFFVSASIEFFVIGEVGLGLNFHPIIFAFNSFAPFLKFMALSNGWKWKRIRWFMLGYGCCFIAIPLYELNIINNELSVFLNSASLNVAIFSCILALIFNRYWSGFTGRILMSAHFVLVFIIGMIRTHESWRRNTIYLVLDARDEPFSWLFFLAAVGCISQLAFLLMLASRTQRYARVKQRREERMRARSVSLNAQNREINRLLDEQRRLLEVLTHEVRQPINNAQAALQNIMSDLRPGDGNQKNVFPVTKRIQKILDDITLSLTNAIIGATVLERGEAAELRDCEIISIAQLALLDSPDNVRERIVVDFPAHDLVLAVDPILLRLALRNLLDNAAKFSPPGTAIEFSISLDEERFGVLISVSNCVSSSFVFERDMLERGKRGHNVAGKEGSGIGLYIVSEIARIHGQKMVIADAEPGKVTFGILLSE